MYRQFRMLCIKKEKKEVEETKQKLNSQGCTQLYNKNNIHNITP